MPSIPDETVSKVETVSLKDSLLIHCENRQDSWSQTVLTRLLSIHDLVAAGAQYHRNCFSHFCCKRNIPTSRTEINGQNKRLKVGKKSDDISNAAFIKVTDFLKENPLQQMTIPQLVQKMQDFLGASDSEAYSTKYMKSKLEEYFKDDIVITSKAGTADIVTIKDKASIILQDFFKESKESLSTEEKKAKIILAAAKIIKNDINFLSP